MDGEEGSENNLFDPVKDVLDDFKSGARAGMDVLNGNGLGKNTSKSNNAANGLKSVEKGASNGGMAQTGDNLASVRKNESNAGGGLYSGAGKAAAIVNNVKGKNDDKGRGKGFLKKGGPIGAIIGIIFIVGFGVIMGGFQLLQPFSLISQFKEAFNSMHVSASFRSNALIRFQMDNGLVKDPIKSKIFKEDTFKITKKQAAELSKRGIVYDDDFDGNGTRVLKYDDGSGEIKVIAADETAATRLTDMDLSKFNTDKIKFNSEAVSFRNLYASDSSFFKNYNDGSLTWRGSIAGWFGSATKSFLMNNKLTRNLFKDFDQKLKESGDNPRTVATDMIAKNIGEVDEGGVRVATTREDENNETVRTKDDFVQSEGTKTGRSSIKSEADVKEKLNKIADDYSGGSLSGTAQKVANYTCLGVNFIGGVSLLVTANEALQIIHLTTGYFEAIDKVMKGDGDDSPLNTLIEALNEKKSNTNAELAYKQKVNISSNMEDNVSESGISTLEVKKTTTNKSAMNSNGITSLYSGSRVDPNDPSVQSFNFSNNIKRILGGLGTSMAAFETCAFAKIAANAIGVVESGLEIAGCIAGVLGAAVTFGTSTLACSTLVTDVVVGAAVSVLAGVLIAGIITTITPVVANILMRDIVTDLGGEDLGNALTSGGNMYLGGTHRSNGGSLSSMQKYVEYAAAHQQVIAEDAKQERLTRDPFDATSKYTFIGVLFNSMMGFLSVDSLSSAIVSTGSVVSSSIAAISPTATAYSIADDLVPMDEYEETCPYLASIGAVGDAFCNPYSITDTSTIELDPSEVTNILDDNFLDETTSDGNVQIDGSSDLAKYILFCDNRNSAFGIADQNIVDQVSNWGNVHTENSTFNNAVNSGIGAIPVVGDLIDVVDNTVALANTGYVGGESCVAGNNVSGQSAPGWDKSKYYQRFIEDQSLMEGMGLIEKSSVTAFLDDYYTENPLDNSYEGLLARYSGLSKENVIALLDIIDYGNYIANYDASERYAFGAPVIEIEKELKFDNENQIAIAPIFILINQTIYADVRNRSFTV